MHRSAATAGSIAIYGNDGVMLPIEILILRVGGLARTSELYAADYWQSLVQLYSAYGRIISAGKGWWATKYTPPAAVAARKLGGRLACVSALQHYGIGDGDGRLHLALERSGKKPREVDVVVHWSRRRLPGDRMSVTVPVARAQAAKCPYNQSLFLNER